MVYSWSETKPSSGFCARALSNVWDSPLTPSPVLLCDPVLFTDIPQGMKHRGNKSFNRTHSITIQRDGCCLNCPLLLQPLGAGGTKPPQVLPSLSLRVPHGAAVPGRVPAIQTSSSQQLEDFAFAAQKGLSPLAAGRHGFAFHLSGAHQSLEPETGIDFFMACLSLLLLRGYVLRKLTRN